MLKIKYLSNTSFFVNFPDHIICSLIVIQEKILAVKINNTKM